MALSARDGGYISPIHWIYLCVTMAQKLREGCFLPEISAFDVFRFKGDLIHNNSDTNMKFLVIPSFFMRCLCVRRAA